jgi:hypothetical protein
VHTLRLVFVLGSGIVAVVAITIWRSQHGVEVWHAAADVPA